VPCGAARPRGAWPRTGRWCRPKRSIEGTSANGRSAEVDLRAFWSSTEDGPPFLRRGGAATQRLGGAFAWGGERASSCCSGKVSPELHPSTGHYKDSTSPRGFGDGFDRGDTFFEPARERNVRVLRDASFGLLLAGSAISTPHEEDVGLLVGARGLELAGLCVFPGGLRHLVCRRGRRGRRRVWGPGGPRACRRLVARGPLVKWRGVGRRAVGRRRPSGWGGGSRGDGAKSL